MPSFPDNHSTTSHNEAITPMKFGHFLSTSAVHAGQGISMPPSSHARKPRASCRIRRLAVILSAVAISLAATGCGPSRAAPAYPLKTGWYYLGPKPTEQQTADALAQMVDGASDHRYTKSTGERYDFSMPAVIFLEEDGGVLTQREPSRIMMAAGHSKMQILGHEAGVLVTIDGPKVMVGDGAYLFQVETFSKLPLYHNPAFIGEQAEPGIVTFAARLDPGGEWYAPKMGDAHILLKDPLVLIAKDRLAKQP